jgi:hypothetical protein
MGGNVHPEDEFSRRKWMAYLDTYSAFVRYGNSKPEQRWTGLTKGQAKWRYHWIKRNWYSQFSEFREYGWEREWQD